MSIASFVKWTKERFLSHILGQISDKLPEYFVDLAGSFTRTFMDGIELTDVCLDAIQISREFYDLGIPVRLKYGHIGVLKFNVGFLASLKMEAHSGFAEKIKRSAERKGFQS